ncbi:hypothetical protein ACHAXR_007952 [Thalassiosira sp. AJA248-18]
MATTEPSKTSRRKRRWGEGPTDNGGGNDDNNNNGESLSKRKSRFSSSPPSSSANGNGGGGGVAPVAATTAASIAPPPAAATDPKARAAALQASIQARLAALKARTGGGGASATTSAAKTILATAPPPPPASSSITATANINKATQKRPLDTTNDTTKSTNKRAKVFELDMTTTAPARLLEKQQREEQLRAEAKPKEKINPYLAHTVVDTTTSHATTAAVATSKKTLLDNDNETTSSTTNNKNEEVLLDTRLAGTHKQRPKSRPINFVTPGTYIALGEKKREQAARAAESGYVSGRKVGNVVKSVGMGGAVPNSIDGEGGGGGGGYYGAGEAGKVVEERLPARIDAPELELDHFATANKKKILTSLSDVDVEKNDVAIAAAVAAATSSMPYAMEWWDAELLPSKLRKELASEEGKAIASRAKKGLSKKNKGAASAAGTASSAGDSISDQYKKDREHHQQLIEKCYQHASISHSKTRTLLQHPVPILTPAQKAALEAAKNKPSTLHLTKAERKRHRKLRRAERLREQQDLQAAGLVPPPEPRLTLSNYMKVLGDQAILDPSKMEATVVEQIQSRKLKHEQMNAERKLTKEQKAAKHARKLAEDTTQSVKVALFYVKDMSHPYHRAKVDLNAQQNGITGGVLECDESESSVNLVVAEGGEKAIKRYTRLMTVRMRWKGEDFYEEEDDEESEEELMVGEDEEENNNGEDDGEDGNNETKKKKEKRKKFNPNNECELIWTGMAVKRAFNSFMFQTAENSTVARKILEAKGVAHYWDLAVGHVERKEGVVGGGPDDGDYGALRFRLGDGGDGASNDVTSH